MPLLFTLPSSCTGGLLFAPAGAATPTDAAPITPKASTAVKPTAMLRRRREGAGWGDDIRSDSSGRGLAGTTGARRLWIARYGRECRVARTYPIPPGVPVVDHRVDRFRRCAAGRHGGRRCRRRIRVRRPLPAARLRAGAD